MSMASCSSIEPSLAELLGKLWRVQEVLREEDPPLVLGFVVVSHTLFHLLQRERERERESRKKVRA